MVTSSELIKIKNQFSANLRATARMRSRLDIIDVENKALMKLISEVEPEDDLMQIKINKAIQKRMLQFK